jgi:uncharacterized FlaG/YvyC family protein
MVSSGVNNATNVYAGYMWRSSRGVDTIGVDVDKFASTFNMYGTAIQAFSTGVKIAAHMSDFYGLYIEDMDVGINALGWNLFFSEPKYFNCDIKRTDAHPEANIWLDQDAGSMISKMRKFQAVDATNIDFKMGDALGTVGINLYDSDDVLKGRITSNGDLIFSGYMVLSGTEGIKVKKVKAYDGENLQIHLTDKLGNLSLDIYNSDGDKVAGIDSRGKVTTYGGILSTKNIKLINGNFNTIENIANFPDGTLSGTPRVFSLSIDGVSYYFKAYPTLS